MILTVCLNPCTDVTIELDSLHIGKMNHIKSKSISFTGAALNVAIGVARLKGQSYATGFMYNENGALFEQALDREGVPSEFIWNRGRVRENYKIIDNKSMLTEINDSGASIAAEKQGHLVDMVARLSQKADIILISGSLPQGVDDSYIRQLYSCVPDHVRKVADMEGKRLLLAMQDGLDLVKPNMEELQSTLNREIRTRDDVLKGCYELLDKGAKVVLASLGRHGAVITDGTKNYFCRSINVAINSTVGAGDGMLAAALLAMENGAPIDEMLRRGVAAGTATVTTFGKISFTKEKYDEILTGLKVEEI